MWKYIVRIILRFRIPILLIIGAITVFMAYEGSNVKMSYEMARMLPDSDPTSIEYEKFRKQFGQDGSVIFVAIKDPELFTLNHYDDWYDITNNVLNINGVQGVVSAARVYTLVRDDSLRKFRFKNIVPQKPDTQKEVDSITKILYLIRRKTF